MEASLDNQAVNLLVLGAKRFLNDNHIGRKKTENYYKVLANEVDFNVCSSCPLNSKFGIELVGCNSFLEYLTEIGGLQMSFRGMSCILEREYIKEALRRIIYNKRFVKI